jgi:cell division protein ZapA
MTAKTDTEVVIGGRVFTLSGYESEEYLQKIALYINNKMAEYSKIDSFKRQSLETQSVLMELNIADDYFKAKKQIAVLEEEKELKEQEIYSLKHDLIASKIKLESLEKTMKAMQEDIAAKDKEIVHLENVKQTATKNGK